MSGCRYVLVVPKNIKIYYTQIYYTQIYYTQIYYTQIYTLTETQRSPPTSGLVVGRYLNWRKEYNMKELGQKYFTKPAEFTYYTTNPNVSWGGRGSGPPDCCRSRCRVELIVELIDITSLIDRDPRLNITIPEAYLYTIVCTRHTRDMC